MIVDRLDQSERYFEMHADFPSAFRFLLSGVWRNLEPGRYELCGERLIAIVASAEGRGRESAPLEVHRRYIDIQYVAEGTDEIGWQSAGRCELPKGDFSSEDDIGFYSDRPILYFPVPAESFAVFFPEDAHAPLAGTGNVRKVIMKVEVAKGYSPSVEESALRRE